MTGRLSRWGPIADKLKVTERTVQRYVKERGLPVKKDLAGHPFITEKEIEEWLLREKEDKIS